MCTRGVVAIRFVHLMASISYPLNLPDLPSDLGTLDHEPMPDIRPPETLTRQQKQNRG
jgi:hypothetical protein